MALEEKNHAPLHDDSSEEQGRGGTPERIEEELAPHETPTAAPGSKEQPIEATEATLPPEAQGETNGGPLGCCLGLVVGVFLTALIITTCSLLLSNGGFLGLATIPFLLLGTILGGYFGWKIGKKLYREYEPPVVKGRQKQARSKPRRV
jgi:hypothetical protein